MIILALNSGSSSLKFGLYRVVLSQVETIVTGWVESIGEPRSPFRAAFAASRAAILENHALDSEVAAIERIARLLMEANLPHPIAIGHRIVHGGPELRHHCLLDDDVLALFKAVLRFAPLHNPAALVVIGAAQRYFPGVAQALCFDTAFHAQLPDVARVLPIAKRLQSMGMRRYGFHGLSCESIVRQLAPNVPSRLIIAHLGNGASITAVRDGKSVDTSMGLTPTGGIIMGTRSGDIDPGLMLYLLREAHFDLTSIGQLFDHGSGLLGISDLSADMRHLQEAAATNPDARLAVQMFCYSASKQIAAMIAALNGVDMLIFTGGIGENDDQVRASICAHLRWIGVGLDPTRNRSSNNPLHDTQSRCAVSVFASQEDEQIAWHAARLLAASGSAA